MNDLSKVVDKLLAQGLLALRGTCVMPRLVNSDYSNLAAQQGASIDVPIPSAIKAQAVTPGATSQDTGDISPVSATIKLDRWMEAPFYLTDKDLMEANRGVIPMQASEAVKAIANDVNATLLGLGRKFYGMVGTPGTTPFSTVVDATNARKVLNRQLAPVNDRRIVLDPDAEAAALGLSGFADVSKSGDARPIIDGTIGRKYGFDWAMDQQVPTFEASVIRSRGLFAFGSAEEGSGVAVVTSEFQNWCFDGSKSASLMTMNPLAVSTLLILTVLMCMEPPTRRCGSRVPGAPRPRRTGCHS